MPKPTLVLHKTKDKQTATLKIAAALAIELTHLAKKTPVLLLLSTGSALNLLDLVDTSGLSHLVTIGALDERFSTDQSINNFSRLTQTQLFTQAKEKGCTFIDTSVQKGDTQEMLRNRLENSLKTWKKTNPKGKIIATQGIGPDGHTSGVMPFPENPKLFAELFMEPNIWVTAYNATGKNPYPLRVTTTLSFLRLVDKSFLFACGHDKTKALSNTLARNGTLAQTPARVIHEMPQVTIFTDIAYLQK